MPAPAREGKNLRFSCTGGLSFYPRTIMVGRFSVLKNRVLQGAFVMPYARSFPFLAMSLVTLTAGVMGFSAPSQAGFEFKPSPVTESLVEAAPMGSTIPSVPALPPEEVEATTLALPVSAEPPASVEPIKMDVVSPPEIQPLPSSLPVQEEDAPAAEIFPNVIGFGNGIPLVLALREIVPPQYAYSFDPSVDQGALVTWNGGKPWNVALADAVKPLDLGLEISGRTIRILPMSQIGAAQQVDAAPESEISHPVDQMEMPANVVAGIQDRPTESSMIAPPGTVSPAPAPVREVYVRRNEANVQVVNRVPGQTAVINPAPQQEFAKDGSDESPSFWARIKENIWSDSDKSEEPAPMPPAPVVKDQVAVVAVKETVVNEPVPLTLDNMDPSSPASAVPPPAAVAKPMRMEPGVKKSVLDPYAVQSWQAEKGASLKDVLDQWSKIAGVEVQWSSAEDYKLPESIHLDGSYTEAITRVLTSYGEGTKRPLGQLHPNLPDGPSVLIIKSDS